MANNSNHEQRKMDEDNKKANWLEADSPKNPFGVRIVNLMDNLQVQSFTQDKEKAACAVSWRPGHQERLKSSIEAGKGIPCDLCYPVATPFPNGMLFIPRAMEDKWVIAWHDGSVLFARSWSGETIFKADAAVESGELRISRIYIDEHSFSGLWDPATVVDWMIRSHCMEERLPLPVDETTADMLHNSPLVAMNVFGHRLFCAGLDYRMPPPKGKLYSLGDLSAAVYANDTDTIRKLSDREESWKTAVATDGSPPLVLASQLGFTELCHLMLELGADIEAKNERGGTALQMGVVGKCNTDHTRVLVDAGANIEAANSDGFTAAHAAAEVDYAEMILFLRSVGANLEAETNAGYRPIHISAGLGHMAAAEALLQCNVDTDALGNGRTPLQIAEAEGKVDFAKWFLAYRKSN